MDLNKKWKRETDCMREKPFFCIMKSKLLNGQLSFEFKHRPISACLLNMTTSNLYRKLLCFKSNKNSHQYSALDQNTNNEKTNERTIEHQPRFSVANNAVSKVVMAAGLNSVRQKRMIFILKEKPITKNYL